jgi:predicted phosphodiesterase
MGRMKEANQVESIAVISDVHGNRWALEAVLADIAELGVSQVVNLGDVLHGPLDPRGTAELLLERGFPTACGNQDREIVDETSPMTDTLAYVRDQLTDTHLDWIRALGMSISFGPVLGFHASLNSDTEYLLWEIGSGGARFRRSRDVQRILTETQPNLILCGHDHVPRTMVLPNGPTVVDPGSVGLPAYWDDVPHPHVMEAGSPHARYAVVTRTGNGYSVADRAIPYDWESAAETAHRNGRPDWATWLRTGQASQED